MNEKLTNHKRMLEYEALSPYSNIFCFTTTRHGGCGKGAYASFNCTPYTGDSSDDVAENQRRLRQLLPQPNELVIPYQTHGTKILTVDDHFAALAEAERYTHLQGVDALITRLTGFCLCISTADCVPVLLYDRAHQVVAAVHAGWRGTVARIVRLTLERMNNLYGTCGKDVVACIGPSISRQAFEVGEEVHAAFRDAGFLMKEIAERHPRSGKWHIDLWEANRQTLTEWGVAKENIEVSGICTYTCCADFFSARRLGVKSGRILSGILIKQTV